MKLRRAPSLVSLVALVGALSAGQAQAFPQVREDRAHSSNYTARSSRSIRYIVIHTIEGSEAGAISWFKNPRANVSAHYVVSHAGRITRMLRDSDIGWHAGNWTYNEQSIGIENEGYAGRNNWTDTQYRALADLVRGLCDRYGIPKDRSRIIGHNEVPRATHWDPGPHFDWSRFMGLVRGGSAAPAPSGGGGGGATAPAGQHIVRRGETLGAIAQRYGVTVDAIVRANGIRNPNMIYPGQVLRIPGRGAAPAPAPAPAPRAGGAVEVTASNLNVRASIMGTVIGAATRGDRFVIRESRSGWHRIDFGGRDAWISGDYARRVSVDGVEVTTSALNVRTGPSTGHGRMGQAGNGDRYVVLGRNGEWVLIQFDNRRGWIHGGYTRGISLR